MKEKSVHKPVLLKEVLEGMNLSEGEVVFDGTLGGGGYALEILKKIGKNGLLIGTDLDKKAIERVEIKLKDWENKRLFCSNYSKISEILSSLKIKYLDAMVLDLGISSDQLEIEDRGISFLKKNDPLDMNLSFDNGSKIKASDILNYWDEKFLADIFYYYGGEKKSYKIASAIVEARKKKKFEKVGQLSDLAERVLGKFYRKKKIHPATKIFQALRITVNDEISHLESFLDQAVNFLSKDGRMAIVTFHSLEDKVVKRKFLEFEKKGLGYRLNKKVIKPSEEEILKNPRARSAKLRIFNK